MTSTDSKKRPRATGEEEENGRGKRRKIDQDERAKAELIKASDKFFKKYIQEDKNSTDHSPATRMKRAIQVYVDGHNQFIKQKHRMRDPGSILAGAVKKFAFATYLKKKDWTKGANKSKRPPQLTSSFGLQHGDMFPSRWLMFALGLHSSHQRGISWGWEKVKEGKPIPVCDAVVCSAEYPDEAAGAWGFNYTGEGGLSNNGFLKGGESKIVRQKRGKLLTHQHMTTGNLALLHAFTKKRPVRVFRKIIPDNKTVPKDTINGGIQYQYLGEYVVRAVWWEPSNTDGVFIWRYKLMPHNGAILFTCPRGNAPISRRVNCGMIHITNANTEYQFRVPTFRQGVREGIFSRQGSIEVCQYPTHATLWDHVSTWLNATTVGDQAAQAASPRLTMYYCVRWSQNDGESPTLCPVPAGPEASLWGPPELYFPHGEEHYIVVMPAPFWNQSQDDISGGLEDNPVGLRWPTVDEAGGADKMPLHRPSFTYSSQWVMPFDLDKDKVSPCAKLRFHFEIFWHSREVGWGLRALEVIEKDAWIGAYTGVLVASELADIYGTFVDPLRYLFELITTTQTCSHHLDYVDAGCVGNALRFINHSEKYANITTATAYRPSESGESPSKQKAKKERSPIKGPKPTALENKINTNDTYEHTSAPHLVLIASRRIEAGEELLLDYEKKFFLSELQDELPPTPPPPGFRPRPSRSGSTSGNFYYQKGNGWFYN